MPFALLLALALVLTWYATFHLARTEAAQPRALRLRRRGRHRRLRARDRRRRAARADRHRSACCSSATRPRRSWRSWPASRCSSMRWRRARSAAGSARLAVLVALPAAGRQRRADASRWRWASPAASSAARSSYEPARRFAPWVGRGATLAAALLAPRLGAWALARRRADADARSGLAAAAPAASGSLWPAWPLALWTLWRWRRHLLQPPHRRCRWRCALVALRRLRRDGRLRPRADARPAGAGRAGRVRAADAASAAPRRRSTGSRCSSSASARSAIWVIYVAMQTGVPAKPAANVARLAPGFVPQLLGRWRWLLAVAGTLAWLVARALAHRRATAHALWKSLVLPAGGVALCWLLLMTLWLPLLDYARSYRPLVAPHRAARAARRLHRRAGHAARAPGRARSTSARWRVDARTPAARDALRLSCCAVEPRRSGCAGAARAGRCVGARAPPDRPRRGRPLIYRAPQRGPERSAAPARRRRAARTRAAGSTQPEASSPCRARSGCRARRRGAARRA